MNLVNLDSFLPKVDPDIENSVLSVLTITLIRLEKSLEEESFVSVNFIPLSSAIKGALTNVTPTTSGTTAFTDFSDVTYSSASFTANAALIYNTTTDGGSGTTDAVCAIAFGGDKTASNGTFKIEFPTNDATAAIIRLA